MRTMAEIAERCRSSDDFLGFEQSALLDFLDFEHAQPFLKPEVTPDQWKSKLLTREAILDIMREYMQFAWEKVENHRGISASRSVTKFHAWCWILGEDEAVEICTNTEYAQYGAPILRALSERFGFPLPSGEVWYERMSTGIPCGVSDCGCGR